MWGDLLPFAAPGGAVAILAGAVWMLFNDKLITSGSHLREIRQLEKDRDAWRAAHELEVARGNEQAEQVRKLLGHAETTVALLSALPRTREPL